MNKPIFISYVFFLVLIFGSASAYAENWYAVNVHVLKNNNYRWLSIVTRTPDKAACDKVLSVKGGPDPMGDDKWTPETSYCKNTDAFLYDPLLNKQPVGQPYAWFMDSDGYPTVIKFIDFKPATAKSMVNSFAAKMRQWGLEVEVIMPET